MASPPNVHSNSSHGSVYGQLVQARDIHGGVTINVPSAPSAPLSDVSLDPPRLATAVHGREELLSTLAEAMEAGAPVPHVLTGPGGFGKTTVAAALAERARADGWTVFWVRPGNVSASMLEAAVELGGSRQEAEQVRPTRHQAARWVWRHLDSAPRPWLLVIDNADQPEELDPDNRPGDQLGWMRASPGGFVLVTSRVDDPALWAPARVHRIGELDTPAATAALTDHAGLTELAGAEELAERLGGVPLALFLAGRILATHQVLFPDAHALLTKLDQDVAALDELAAPFVTGGDAERKLLSGVWELSLRLVAEKDSHTAPLLRLLSVLGPNSNDIPLRRLPVYKLRGGVLDGLDEAGLARTINALVVHGLVSVTSPRGETALRLHPLVSEIVCAHLTDADIVLMDEAEQLLSWQRDRDLLFELGALFSLTKLRLRLHPNAEENIIATLTGFQETTTAVLKALFRISVSTARSQLRLGRPHEVETALTSHLAIAQEHIGQDDPLVLTARHYLAESMLAQNRVDEAEETFRSLYEDCARALGADHQDTLEALYQRGLIAIRRERWHEAAETLGSVREQRTRTSGEEDPLALFAAQNLAYVTMRQGDPATAETEFRRVHAVRERVLGPDHHMTADAAFYVARAAQEQGDAKSALAGFTEVLHVWNAQLGPEHPQVEMVERCIAEVRRIAVHRPEVP